LLFNVKEVLFLSISWRKFDDDEYCFVLCESAQEDFYSASSLKQQSTEAHVAAL